MSSKRVRFIALAAVSAAVAPGFACFSDDDFSLGEWRTEDGAFVPPEVVMADNGESHCRAQDVWWVMLGRTEVSSGLSFLRDSDGVLFERVQEEPFGADVRLPANAIDPGLSTKEAELWLDPDESAAYLVFDDRVERWPRTVTDPGCD